MRDIDLLGEESFYVYVGVVTVHMRWDRLEWSSGKCSVPERNEEVMENGGRTKVGMYRRGWRLALGASGFNGGSGAYWEERDGGIQTMVSFFQSACTDVIVLLLLAKLDRTRDVKN